MRRSEWTLNELYDRTERILEAEITPILKGSYRIQGPVDDSNLELGRTNSGVFPTEEKFMFVNDSIGMKVASGTCNICSAPCSSCMHDYHSSSVIGSTSDSGCSGNICSRGKADICFSVDVNGTTLYKCRTCDDSQNAASETSYMLGMSSSHNSYSENAESKATLKASAAYDLEDLDKPQMGFSGEVVEKEQPLEEKTDQGHFSADSHISTHLGCRDPSGQGEEQHGLECHGDNISCITEGIDTNISVYSDNLYLDKKDMTCSVVLTNNLLLNANENSVLTEAGDGLQVHETEEGHCIFQRSNATANPSLLNDTSNSASVNTTPNNLCFPLLKVDVSPSSSSPHSHSKNMYSSFHKADFRDTEGNLNMKFQAGCMKFAKTNSVESSLGSFSAVSSVGRKPGALRNIEISRTNEARSCLSSDNSKVDDLCQEFKTDTNSQMSSDNGSKRSDLKEPLEKGSVLLDLETTNRQGYNLLPQENTEVENSESESTLYDVKICDICGDAGREDLLAICSRCSDGAEHTYCMWEKLDKLPGFDWLCEECKIKEMENHNVDKSNSVSGGSKPTCLSKNSQNFISTSIPKKLPKLDAGVIDLDAQGLTKGLESPKISTRRQADHVEGIKASEVNAAPIEIASPRKTPVLSRVISSKNQEIKVKMAKKESSSEGQSVNGLQAFHHPQNSLSSGSFKGQPQLHSPYRHFSRSVSFNNSIINQKVKQLVENVPCKQKIKREAMSSNLRKETLVKSITKSASFKSSSSGCSNTEPASKDQSLHPSLIENPRGLDEVKELITVGKKNPSAMYTTSISTSAAPARNCLLKINRKFSQNEGKVKSTIESSCQSIIKRSYDASDLGCNDSKKRILHSSRSMEFFNEKFNSENHKQWQEVIRTGFSAIDGSCIKVDMVSQYGVLQPSELNPNDNKIRDSNIFISPRLSSSGGNRTLHSLKCNKTGHATQQCSTDKLEGSAYKPSAEQSLRETLKKGKECEDVVDAMLPKIRTLKGKNLDKLDKLPAVNGEMICKADSRNTPSSFSQRKIALVVDSGSGNDSLKKFSVELGRATTATDSSNLAVQPTESLFVPKANNSSHIPTVNELNVKSLSETSLGDASILASQLRASAIPKLECIWQGSFNVLRFESPPQLFDGIQAHLSIYASHRVPEVANVVPSKMQLEEVSQRSSWPLHCQGIGPKEENIALFFFAKDNESYEKSYSCLLNKMLKDDLALRGKVDEVELLIFTSKMLPAYSQRWNKLYYLWGMFIGERKHCLATQKKHCESNLGEFLDQGVAELPFTNGSNAQNLDTTVTLKILSERDTSPKIKRRESAMRVDLHPISSEVEHKAGRTKNASFAMNSLNQVVADAKITQEIPLFFGDNSSRTTAKPMDVTCNTELQLQTPQLSYEVKIGMGCQDKFLSDGRNGKIGESPSHASDTNMEASLGSASPVPSVSPNSNPGEGCSKNECKKKKRHGSPTNVAILGYNPRGNMLEIDHLSCKSWVDRKRVRSSCSTDTVSQTSCERASCVQVDDEREHKMTYYSIGSGFGDENLCSRLSFKVHPVFSTLFSQQQQTQNICIEPVMPKISGIVERCFFPVDVGPSRNNKYGNTTHILSSDDDDNPESYTPDLELTLGGKSKITKPAPLPLLLSSVNRSSQHRRPDPSGNDGVGDDLSSLLSL